MLKFQLVLSLLLLWVSPFVFWINTLGAVRLYWSISQSLAEIFVLHYNICRKCNTVCTMKYKQVDADFLTLEKINHWLFQDTQFDVDNNTSTKYLNTQIGKTEQWQLNNQQNEKMPIKQTRQSLLNKTTCQEVRCESRYHNLN